MTGLNHVLTGITIGAAVQKPALVVPIAFLSHFVLDMVPHFGGMDFYKWGHKHFWKIMFTDGFLCVSAVIICAVAAPELALPIILGGFFAILPDLMWIDFFGGANRFRKFNAWHKKIQWFERPPGAVVEAAYLISMIFVVSSLI